MDKGLTYHYYNSHSLLVINPQGIIKIVYTPFRALFTCTEGLLPPNTWLYVEEVISNEKDELFFMVHGKLYSHKTFRLMIHF